VRTEVMAIDRSAQVLKVRELATGRDYEQPYNALILSTGASPLKPPIPGIDRPGHFTVRNIPDVERIMAWIKDCHACRAVVVGGGYIGLEMAEQLKRRGLGVTILEALPQVMTPLDPEMAAWLHAELAAHGVALHLNDPVAGFEPPGAGETARASVVVLKSGKRIEADTVVLSTGIEAPRDNKRLADMLKVPLNADGFFVEAHLKLRPVDFTTEGIFLCGLAHSPKLIDESIVASINALPELVAGHWTDATRLLHSNS